MGGWCGKEPGPPVQIPLLDSRVQAHWREALLGRKQGDPPGLQESGYCLALLTQTSVLTSAGYTLPPTPTTQKQTLVQ